MNLIEPIHQYAIDRPDSPALLTPQGNISWSQLDNLIWSTALSLLENGLKAGDRVGITMAHPVIHLVTSLALTRMGVAHIAIAPSESDTQINQVIHKLKLRNLVTDLQRNSSTSTNILFINKLSAFKISIEQKKNLSSNDGELTWLILQSSGTTGSPKFSELNHNNTLKRLEQFLNISRVISTDIVWVPSKVDFFISKYTLIRTLRAGATACIPIGLTVSHQLLDFLNANKVTIAIGTPSLMAKMVELNKPISTIRYFGVTSSPVSNELKKDFKLKVNPNLYISYATNETGTITIAPPSQQDAMTGMVGQVDSKIQIEIVDINGIPLPTGQPGHIRVKVPGSIMSYLDNQEATNNSFKDSWFYPGDLGLLDSANQLVFLGRKDDMMIYDGINIYPSEIESILSAHPDIIEAAAFPLKHKLFHQVPVAAVMLKKTISEQDLLSYCNSKLGIKSPKRIFVVNDFPRNPMGKILKRELPKMIIAQEKSKSN